MKGAASIAPRLGRQSEQLLNLCPRASKLAGEELGQAALGTMVDNRRERMAFRLK